MILVVAAIPLLLWIYLLAFHGSFWRSSPVLGTHRATGAASVAVVVPARNEAESIRQSIGSLLAQDYPGKFHVILVDDNSTDGTGEIAASLNAAHRLTILRGAPLPAGWSGKLWAVHQGLAHPAARAAGYVLLTDADIEHAPKHVGTLVAKAQSEQLDLVSEMVRLHSETAAEHALIPAFVFFFQMLYPFAWVADSQKRTAAAAGGTMLVSRAALDRMDGVSLIREKLIDDCALAQQIKSTGGRIWLGHAELAASTRVYPGWRDIADMIARTAYVQLGRSPWMLLGCIAGMGLVYIAPPLLTAFATGVARGMGLAAWLLMAIAFHPTLRRYRQSPLWGLALPGIALFYLAATILSAIRHFAGRGGGWKQRVYPGDPAA